MLKNFNPKIMQFILSVFTNSFLNKIKIIIRLTKCSPKRFMFFVLFGSVWM